MTGAGGRRLGLAVAVLALAPAPAGAQKPEPSAADRPLATRAELEALARQLAAGAGSDGAARLARVRARLEGGDFRPGDRLVVTVQGEASLSDTFSVGPTRELLLPSPTVGTLDLAGVLRSELEARVQEYVSRFVLDPVVRARPLLRVSVEGEVVRAGYYDVPADAPLADVLMAAGGATARAEMRKLRIEREGEEILEGSTLERAVADGWTLDEAGLRSGDRLVVERRRDGGLEGNLRFLWVVLSIAGSIYGLSRAF